MIPVQIADFKIEKMNKSEEEEGCSGFGVCLFVCLIFNLFFFFWSTKNIISALLHFFKLTLNKKS